MGTLWCSDAKSFILDSTNGHIIGKVIRKSKAPSRATKNTSNCYNIAREYSVLGEYSITSGYLLEASHIGSRMYRLRQDMGRSDSTNTNKVRNRANGIGRCNKNLKAAIPLLGYNSEEEGIGHAPSSESDTDSMVEEDEDVQLDDFQWLLCSDPRPENHEFYEDDIE
jgi:hypothetical protein